MHILSFLVCVVVDNIWENLAPPSDRVKAVRVTYES